MDNENEPNAAAQQQLDAVALWRTYLNGLSSRSPLPEGDALDALPHITTVLADPSLSGTWAEALDALHACLPTNPDLFAPDNATSRHLFEALMLTLPPLLDHVQAHVDLAAVGQRFVVVRDLLKAQYYTPARLVRAKAMCASALPTGVMVVKHASMLALVVGKEDLAVYSNTKSVMADFVTCLADFLPTLPDMRAEDITGLELGKDFVAMGEALGEGVLSFLPTITTVLLTTLKSLGVLSEEDIESTGSGGGGGFEESKQGAGAAGTGGGGGGLGAAEPDKAVEVLLALDAFAGVVGAVIMECPASHARVRGEMNLLYANLRALFTKCPHMRVRAAALGCATTIFWAFSNLGKEAKTHVTCLEILEAAWYIYEREETTQGRHHLIAHVVGDLLQSCAESRDPDKPGKDRACIYIKLETHERDLMALKLGLAMLRCLLRLKEAEDELFVVCDVPQEERQQTEEKAAREQVDNELDLMTDLSKCLGHLIAAQSGDSLFDQVIVRVVDALEGKESFTLWTAILSLLVEAIESKLDLTQRRGWLTNTLHFVYHLAFQVDDIVVEVRKVEALQTAYISSEWVCTFLLLSLCSLIFFSDLHPTHLYIPPPSRPPPHCGERAVPELALGIARDWDAACAGANSRALQRAQRGLCHYQKCRAGAHAISGCKCRQQHCREWLRALFATDSWARCKADEFTVF